MVLYLNKEFDYGKKNIDKDTGLPSSFLDDMAEVTEALEDAGFDPFDQLTGYLRTGDERYITRDGGAREIVTKMDVRHIKVYLKQYKKMK